MSEDAVTICPLCNDAVDKLLYRYHIDGEKQVIEKIKQQNPGWSVQDGICSRCVDYYHTEVVMQQRILPEVGPYFPVKNADEFIILPTGLRLDADQRFTGKEITICFIDSGFYIHPDLVKHRNRIKLICDITNQERGAEYFTRPHPESWHGMMTSVVCAGDGYLSKGLYKGIASDAELVLLKVQNEEGKITTGNIVNALKWVKEYHKEFGIRIVNMSLGADEAESYRQSEIDILAEQLISEGVIVVAAAGNGESGDIKPPANSPQVITVGGANDNNQIRQPVSELYHSSFGKTTDGLMKPELIAQAIWVAAPLLPGSKEQQESELLHRLLKLSGEELIQSFSALQEKNSLGIALPEVNDPSRLKEAIVKRIRECKFISPHYMHVDGTSFAAPIVSAVIAQLLEAAPQLTAAAARELLFSTAKRIPGWPAERQGFGLIAPRKALFKTLKKTFIMKPQKSPFLNAQQQIISFYLQHECASQVSLAGNFNHWAQDILLMEPGENGIWKIDIPMLPAGKYQYKFFVDEKVWIEDVSNPYREPDGFSGFNSILIIEN
ncbi:MAG: S8 family serine peptidase [Chitinophagales bacterium]|nr:S8 family serine peptidase [Chitinophagales bacterium]